MWTNKTEHLNIWCNLSRQCQLPVTSLNTSSRPNVAVKLWSEELKWVAIKLEVQVETILWLNPCRVQVHRELSFPPLRIPMSSDIPVAVNAASGSRWIWAIRMVCLPVSMGKGTMCSGQPNICSNNTSNYEANHETLLRMTTNFLLESPRNLQGSSKMGLTS